MALSDYSTRLVVNKATSRNASIHSSRSHFTFGSLFSNLGVINKIKLLMSDGDKGGGGPSSAGVSSICLALFDTSVILEVHGHSVRPPALFYNVGPTNKLYSFFKPNPW